MVYFLVDEIKNNGILGLVYNYDKFMHNMQRFGMDYFNEFQKRLDDSPKGYYLDIMPCGRFICIIQQTKSKSETFMLLSDTNNKYENAENLSTYLLKYPNGEEYQKLFLNTFKEMESDYENLYNEVEMTLESLPLN